MSPRSSPRAAAALAAGLCAVFIAVPCAAQTTDMQPADAAATDNPAAAAAPQAESTSAGDLWTPNTQAKAAKADELFHHHSGGDGVDDKPPAALRPATPAKDSAFPEQAGRVGLVEDDMPLPGEMADTPETRKPLFAKRDTGLAQEPDPWIVPKK